jgi:hypothetical protein
MTETNFRALCEELMNEAIYLGVIPYNQAPNPELIARTRAALAQSEPAPPTDEDLLRVAASKIDPYEGFGIAIGEYEQETECAIEVYGSELIAFAHAVLARWGTPANNTRGTH